MKLSDLRSAADVHEQDMGDPEYKREYERTKLANDVAVRVLAYRTKHQMTQAELASRLGMRQPNIARLESGEHEPSLSTLARLSLILGLDFSIDIKAGGLELRQPPRRRRTSAARMVVCQVPARAALANASRRRGAWTLVARGRSQASGGEPLIKASGSGKVVSQDKRAAGRQRRRTG